MKDRTSALWLGLGGGVAAATVFPYVFPVLAEAARPLVKALLKQSLLAADRLRTGAARASEALEDLLAEVRAEVEQELAARHAAAAAGAEAMTPEAVIATQAAEGTRGGNDGHRNLS